jgi:16S rRNA (cytidine1402-2'-O)-methyltransferase
VVVLKRQKSFENEMPTCYIVATPIGNLEEMTPRAIDILKNVDVIACEDTRHTQKLLKHFNIENKVISHHDHNERESAKGILMLLMQGNNVALVSDAGYPLISDPGYLLVESITAHGFNVVPISGSSALLAGLVASGLVTQPFLFQGFLPTNDKEARGVLTRIRHYEATIVLYEAPHRIEKTLKLCLEVMGDRKATLARELTKKHEEFLRGTLFELVEEAKDLKGEMVLIIEGSKAEKEPDISMMDIRTHIEELIQSGLSAKDAIKQIAKMTGMSKNEIYSMYHNENNVNH